MALQGSPEFVTPLVRLAGLEVGAGFKQAISTCSQRSSNLIISVQGHLVQKAVDESHPSRDEGWGSHYSLGSSALTCSAPSGVCSFLLLNNFHGVAVSQSVEPFTC